MRVGRVSFRVDTKLSYPTFLQRLQRLQCISVLLTHAVPMRDVPTTRINRVSADE